MRSHPELLFLVAMFVCAHRAGMSSTGTAADAPSAVEIYSFRFLSSFSPLAALGKVEAVCHVG